MHGASIRWVVSNDLFRCIGDYAFIESKPGINTTCSYLDSRRKQDVKGHILAVTFSSRPCGLQTVSGDTSGEELGHCRKGLERSTMRVKPAVPASDPARIRQDQLRRTLKKGGLQWVPR
jgi:hypothetical protein